MRRRGALPWLALAALLLSHAAAVAAATPAATSAAAGCTPRCRGTDAALGGAVDALRGYVGDEAGPPAAGGVPACHLRVHTRGEALHAASGTWLILLGKSWIQAHTFGLLQARRAPAVRCARGGLR
jgi:hypothetical protein